MKPVDVKDDTYIGSSKEVNDKNPKLQVDDNVRISKYKNIFVKGYARNWSEEVFVISEIKNTVPWTYVINDLNGEEIIGTFYEKELQKTNRRQSRIEKVFKVGLSPSKRISVICLIESPLKMMKNAFYFTSKALFVLKIFKFLS